jgi:hypothetical protein
LILEQESVAPNQQQQRILQIANFGTVLADIERVDDTIEFHVAFLPKALRLGCIRIRMHHYISAARHLGNLIAIR